MLCCNIWNTKKPGQLARLFVMVTLSEKSEKSEKSELSERDGDAGFGGTGGSADADGFAGAQLGGVAHAVERAESCYGGAVACCYGA